MRLNGHSVSKYRVLIVEDEPLIALDFEELLRSSGYEVVGPMPSIDAALDAIASQEIDVALLDLNLHGRLSTPVAAELKRRQIPFFLVTAYEKLLAKDNPLIDGITILGKPVDAQRLLAHLTSLIGPHIRA